MGCTASYRQVQAGLVQNSITVFCWLGGCKICSITVFCIVVLAGLVQNSITVFCTILLAGWVHGSSHCVSDAHRTHDARVRVATMMMLRGRRRRRVMMRRRRINLFNSTVRITTTILFSSPLDNLSIYIWISVIIRPTTQITERNKVQKCTTTNITTVSFNLRFHVLEIIGYN